MKSSSCGKVCNLRENKFIKRNCFANRSEVIKSNAPLPQEIDQKFITELHQQMNIYARAVAGSILPPQNNKNA